MLVNGGESHLTEHDHSAQCPEDYSRTISMSAATAGAYLSEQILNYKMRGIA
jgi:hypothetical protein